MSAKTNVQKTHCFSLIKWLVAGDRKHGPPGALDWLQEEPPSIGWPARAVQLHHIGFVRLDIHHYPGALPLSLGQAARSEPVTVHGCLQSAPHSASRPGRPRTPPQPHASMTEVEAVSIHLKKSWKC